MKYNNYDTIKEIDTYFREVKKTKPLTRSEERELSIKIKQGDKKSLDRLVTANLKYVISVAKGYRNTGVPFTDLVAEGNLGLIRAAEKFDGTRNIKFISYAIWWIKAAINDCVAKYKPTNDDVDVDDFIYKNLTSDEDGVKCGIGNLFADDIIDVNHRLDSIDVLFNVLKEREIKILKMYYGLNGKEMTLDEIGNSLNLTNERVRQIKQKAIDKLRAAALTSVDFNDMKSLY